MGRISNRCYRVQQMRRRSVVLSVMEAIRLNLPCSKDHQRSRDWRKVYFFDAFSLTFIRKYYKIDIVQVIILYINTHCKKLFKISYFCKI